MFSTSATKSRTSVHGCALFAQAEKYTMNPDQLGPSNIPRYVCGFAGVDSPS